MNFSYLKSISSSDEALFSSLGKEVKTKQIMVFAGSMILSLIMIHRSPILAVPFFLLGLVYLNYSDDIIPLTSYLSVYQQYRKLKKGQNQIIQKEQLGQKKQIDVKAKLPQLKTKLPRIPTEIQLLVTGVITVSAGVYGIYSSVFNEDFAGLITGAVLTALGIVILLSIISPFLNKIGSENPND